jgi:acid phosphatase (class A)
MRVRLTCVLLALALGACATGALTIPEPARTEKGFAVGYLPNPPNGRVFLAPPPADGSPVQRTEMSLIETARPAPGSPRWEQAKADNQIDAFIAFAAPLGRALSPEETVNSRRLLARLTTDVASAYDKAKEEFARLRPFRANGAIPVCGIGKDAADRAFQMDRLANSKSYPSGHAAFGWAWALLFAEIAPEQADAILARGREYGDSRVICGFHYPSDVEAGRLVGAAVVARLRADPAFQRDFGVMRAEVRAALGLRSQ